MDMCLITGSGGLIGNESARFFAEKNFAIAGIDNDMRSHFFGESASTSWCVEQLRKDITEYYHHSLDIRNLPEVEKVFDRFNQDIKLVIHTAAQPSHDWAAKEPLTDFSINATGTLNMLEMTRKYCPDAVFIFTSTNKVYGDSPNFLPLVELETRFEIDSDHRFYTNGIDESMSIDASKHSIFGASKVAADILVQEYGRYFGIKTACFRGGCLTGSNHSGAELHGFLSYLVQCATLRMPYTIYGYQGKQVRDNIHSYDLVNMFWHFYTNPRTAEIYNAGGGRYSNCSVIEAIAIIEEITGNKISYSSIDKNRNGDHIWWVSDVSKFRRHYPLWEYRFNLRQIIEEIHLNLRERIM